MAITTTVIAAAGLTYTVYAGEKAQSTQRQARYRQRDAHNEATRIQMVERSRAVQEEMRADRPTPAETIEIPDDGTGNPTDRTGGMTERMKLARRSMLGGL